MPTRKERQAALDKMSKPQLITEIWRMTRRQNSTDEKVRRVEQDRDVYHATIKDHREQMIEAVRIQNGFQADLRRVQGDVRRIAETAAHHDSQMRGAFMLADYLLEQAARIPDQKATDQKETNR